MHFKQAKATWQAGMGYTDEASVQLTSSFERVLGQMQAALAVRSLGHELNATLKDTFLVQDLALVTPMQEQADVLYQRIESQLEKLPESEIRPGIHETLLQCRSLVMDGVGVQTQWLASSDRLRIHQARMMEQVQALNQTILTQAQDLETQMQRDRGRDCDSDPTKPKCTSGSGVEQWCVGVHRGHGYRHSTVKTNT